MQNYELKSEKIKNDFQKSKEKSPEAFKKRLKISWSIWMFGIEPLEEYVKRLKSSGVDWIELKGDQHTVSSGTKLREVMDKLVKDTVSYFRFREKEVLQMK